MHTLVLYIHRGREKIIHKDASARACDGRQCFTHFYYIVGIGPSILVNDSSARTQYHHSHLYVVYVNEHKTVHSWSGGRKSTGL